MGVLLDGDYAVEMLRRVQESTRSIDIAMYLFRYNINKPEQKPTELLFALAHAARNGVRVRIVTDFPNDAAKIKEAGIQCFCMPAHKRLHAKLAIFDGEYAIVGSHNISTNSAENNKEVSYQFCDPEDIELVQLWFNGIWLEYGAGAN